MTAQDTLIESLERCAELDIDLTASIYDEFFATYPDAIPLMGHSDQYMRGRMVDQAFELLMDSDQQGEGGYLRWEIDNHLDSYGVQVDMYPAFLNAMRHAVAGSLADAWTDNYAQAWAARIDAILHDIEHHAAQKQTA